MLDRSLLAAVAAVVREGSFERASRLLHVTPSAVSQRVKLLEERLGSVLVVRGQPCTATEIGARICQHAEMVAMLESELRSDLPEFAQALGDSARPSIRIAVNADSLGTWFIGAMADFVRHDDTLLDVAIDDQDHTAEWLRSGRVLGAVTSLAEPVAGCRSRRLGVLRYLAVASPAFVRHWFADGVTATTLAAAPSLLFDRKDRLQAQWARRLLRREVELPAHRLPAAQAFLDAALAGLGWGMNPEPLVREHLAAGRLAELAPGRPLDVPLFWQSARLPLRPIERLTASVLRAAGEALTGASAAGRC
jgi:LysR family transcriptional regulator (chromosome initiation inhibitor)